MTGKNLMLMLAAPQAGFFTACTKDDGPTPCDELPFPVPEKYTFTRDGESTNGLYSRELPNPGPSTPTNSGQNRGFIDN